MEGIPGIEALAGLVFLGIVVVPLGIVLVRGLERFVGHRWKLSPLERVLVAFFASGGLLFAVASVPLPLFFPGVVLAILAIGAGAYIAIAVLERGAGVRHFLTWLRTLPAVTILGATIGLLVLYVWTIGTLSFGNGWDGPLHSLFTTVLLRDHTVAWTLAPYENSGVVYPQGAPVWEALPVILYGWPVAASPVLLPALFLSFTPAAAYCWGERMAGFATPAGSRMGLLFAGFFGLLASWPRLFVGGSYDFTFALPIFLVALGWVPDFARNPLRPWRDVIAMGLLVGVTIAVSATIGIELILLFGASCILHLLRNRDELGRLALRFGAVLAFGVGFLARSFLGFIVWFGYPGHTLSAAGSPPYSAAGLTLLPPYRQVTGELDPFVLWKGKLSPIPYLSLEIMLLLAGGFVLMGLCLRYPKGRLGRHVPATMVRSVAFGTLVTFVTVALLLAFGYVGGPLTLVTSITDIDEFSYLLFIFYSAVALLPLAASLGYLEHHRHPPPPARSEVEIRPTHSQEPRKSPRRRSVSGPWTMVVALAVIAQPLALGTISLESSVPNYLSSHVEEFANVTDADVDALEWAGAHLPSCSRVLVAPGSAARYLPEFASVHLLSIESSSWNLSYNRAVADLSDGVYDGATHDDLVQIQATEVFVTGQTSVEFPPFLPGPLESSADFALLFHEGDAFIFAFEPEVRASGCSSS